MTVSNAEHTVLQWPLAKSKPIAYNYDVTITAQLVFTFSRFNYEFVLRCGKDTTLRVLSRNNMQQIKAETESADELIAFVDTGSAVCVSIQLVPKRPVTS